MKNKLVEAWGSGIRRIIGAAREYSLPVPTVEVFDDMFRVILFRNVQDSGNGSDFGVNGGENFGDKNNVSKNGQKVTGTQQKILDCIAEKIGMSGRTVENNIKKMKASEILARHGSPKSGYWEIIE